MKYTLDSIHTLWKALTAKLRAGTSIAAAADNLPSTLRKFTICDHAEQNRQKSTHIGIIAGSISVAVLFAISQVIWHMPRLRLRLFRYAFQLREHTEVHMHHDTSALYIQRNIPYINDGDMYHLLDVYRPHKEIASIPSRPAHNNAMQSNSSSTAQNSTGSAAHGNTVQNSTGSAEHHTVLDTEHTTTHCTRNANNRACVINKHEHTTVRNSCERPLIFTIHGGGLFASTKDTNLSYNYAWAHMGYDVVSISYPLIPQTTFWQQIDDCMSALRYVVKHQHELGVSCKQVFILGDSAGALLSYMVAAINATPALQNAFHIQGTGVQIQGMGLVSIMLDTQRHDVVNCISHYIAKPQEIHEAYYQYIMNPVTVAAAAQHHGKSTLPPAFLITGDQDIIQKDTFKLHRELNRLGITNGMMNYPKGTTHSLEHVFAVAYPNLAESQEVRQLISRFWQQHAQA